MYIFAKIFCPRTKLCPFTQTMLTDVTTNICVKLNGENGFIIKSELAAESCTVAK